MCENEFNPKDFLHCIKSDSKATRLSDKAQEEIEDWQKAIDKVKMMLKLEEHDPYHINRLKIYKKALELSITQKRKIDRAEISEVKSIKFNIKKYNCYAKKKKWME